MLSRVWRSLTLALCKSETNPINSEGSPSGLNGVSFLARWILIVFFISFPFVYLFSPSARFSRVVLNCAKARRSSSSTFSHSEGVSLSAKRTVRVSSRVLNSSMRACVLFSFIFSFFLAGGMSFPGRDVFAGGFDACLDGESFLLFHCSFLSSFLSFFLCFVFFSGVCAPRSVRLISTRTAFIVSYFGNFVKFSVQTFAFSVQTFAEEMGALVVGEWGGWSGAWGVWIWWSGGGGVGRGWASKTPQNTPKPAKTIQNSVGVSPLLFC